MIEEATKYRVRCDDCPAVGGMTWYSAVSVAVNVAIGASSFEIRGKDIICPTCAAKRDAAPPSGTHDGEPLIAHGNEGGT